ncbi:hypothetical protein FRC20_002375 [Serendipita sp. 405]|nr:hypothetical protein FRC15_001271 [Serendipita sp. 397]KAG8849162.1 hypothetical protein FRC20_002375 [Serendipita sp. 405]
MSAEPSVKSDVIEQSALQEAASIQVWSETGEAVTFGSLFEHQKTIVVFIRHFLCGMCQAYVEELGKIPKSSLDAAGTRVVVIGCGEWSVIKQYKADSDNYPYEIFAEPTRELHRTLGLISSMKGPAQGEPKRSYVPSIIGTTFTSIARGLRNLSSATKVGNFSQLGGDFVLGPGLEVTFAWRMRNSQDHVEIDDLMKAAGVAYSSGTSPTA